MDAQTHSQNLQSLPEKQKTTHKSRMIDSLSLTQSGLRKTDAHSNHWVLFFLAAAQLALTKYT